MPVRFIANYSGPSNNDTIAEKIDRLKRLIMKTVEFTVRQHEAI